MLDVIKQGGKFVVNVPMVINERGFCAAFDVPCEFDKIDDAEQFAKNIDNVFAFVIQGAERDYLLCLWDVKDAKTPILALNHAMMEDADDMLTGFAAMGLWVYCPQVSEKFGLLPAHQFKEIWRAHLTQKENVV